MRIEIFNKCSDVIKSCLNKKQLIVAEVYIDIALINEYIRYSEWETLNNLINTKRLRFLSSVR